MSSFAPSTKRSHPESDFQMVLSVMGLDCMIDMVGYMSIVLYSCRVAVASFVANRCYMEDTYDPCSS